MAGILAPLSTSPRWTRRLWTGVALSLLLSPLVHADILRQGEKRTSEKMTSEGLVLHSPPRLLLAQWDGDDSYDPFADYSEFEETEDEEADINFFRNGRLFTISLAAAFRGFTSELGTIYDSNSGFGLFLTYFFDLRFAIQMGFVTGDNNLNIQTGSATSSATGTVSLSGISFSIKYFLNTQNVTRGLARMNPYIIGGVTQFHRTVNLVDEVAFAKDSALGVDLGVGIEIPLLRGKLFFGAQAVYHLVNFADESRELVINDEGTGVTPGGDIYTLQGVLGVNF